MKENKKGIFYYILIAATALGLLELILYLIAGRTSFDPNYSVYAIVGMSLGILCGAISVVKPIRALAFAEYLCFLYAFIHYIVSQINLIANILYDVDGSSFPPVFFVTVIASFAAFVLALVAGLAMKGKNAAKEGA